MSIELLTEIRIIERATDKEIIELLIIVIEGEKFIMIVRRH